MAILWPATDGGFGALAELRAALVRAEVDTAPLVSIKCTPQGAFDRRASIAVYRRKFGASLDHILDVVGWGLPDGARSRIAPLLDDPNMIDYVHFGVDASGGVTTRKLYLAFHPPETAPPKACSFDPDVLLIAVKWSTAGMDRWTTSTYRDVGLATVDELVDAVLAAGGPEWRRAASELLAGVAWRVGARGDALLVEDEGSERRSVDARVGRSDPDSDRCVARWLSRYGLRAGNRSCSVLRVAAGLAGDRSPFITFYARPGEE